MKHTLLAFIILCGLSLGAQVTFVIEAYGAPALVPIGNFAVKEHGEGSGFFEMNQHIGQEYGINIGYMLRKNLEIGIGTTYMKYGYSFNRYSTHVNYDDVFLDRNSGSIEFELYGIKSYVRTKLNDHISISLALQANTPFYVYRSQSPIITGLLFYTGTNSNGELDLFGFQIKENMRDDGTPFSHGFLDLGTHIRIINGLNLNLHVKYRSLFDQSPSYEFVAKGTNIDGIHTRFNDIEVRDRFLYFAPSLSYKIILRGKEKRKK